jgi:hypothetical protein
MDRGEERVEGEAQRDMLRRQGVRVHRRALLAAGLITGLALLWP